MYLHSKTMIPYKTYPMHEKVQRERYFLIKTEFNLPYVKDCRLNDLLDTYLNHSKEFPSMEMQEGDVITLKAYKTSVDATLYTYLVCYYSDGVKVDCGYETSMSLDFVLINRAVFEEVTEAIVREQRINEILGE
jgi:hypothetical protein